MKRKLIVSLSALILTAALVLTAAIMPANVTAINGGTIGYAKEEYEFEKAGFKNSMDYLMNRDGFIFGADYNIPGTLAEAPTSLGDNFLTGDSCTFPEDAVKRDFYNMKALGFNCTQWWLTWDLQGVEFDENGLAVSIQDLYLNNMRKMLDAARAADINIIPAISDHNLLNVNGFANVGSEARLKYIRYQWDEEAMNAWFENVITPIVKVLAEYPDIIPAIAIGIENMTGMVDDYDLGLLFIGTEGTTMDLYAKFYNGLHAVCREYMPNTPTAIEQAASMTLRVSGVWERMYLQNKLDVDLVCQNYYHSRGAIEPNSNAFVERPGFVGEYNVLVEGSPTVNGTEDYIKLTQQYAYRHARANGWMGAFLHRYSREITYGSVNFSNYDQYRPYITTWRYDVQDQINMFLTEQGRENEIPKYEAPSPLYYLGGTTLYWSNGRDVKFVDIERSEDGGQTWKTVGKNLDAVDAVEGNGLGKYVDNSLESGKTYCYRVTGIWEDGTRVTSVATNEAVYYVPPELVKDGGFESGSFVADETLGWRAIAPNTGYETAAFISDEQVHSGKYALKIDTVNNNATGYTTVRQKFVGTEAGKVYATSYWRYIVQAEYSPKESYNEPATCVLTNSNFNTIQAQFFTSTSGTGEWVKGSLDTMVGNNSDIGIKFMSGTKNHKIIFYIDDVSVKEVR